MVCANADDENRDENNAKKTLQTSIRKNLIES